VFVSFGHRGLQIDSGLPISDLPDRNQKKYQSIDIRTVRASGGSKKGPDAEG